MTAMGPARRLRGTRPDAVGGAVRMLRIVGLAVLLWAVASEHHSDGSPRVPAALLVVTAAAWIAWLGLHQLDRPKRETWLALAVLAGAGGVVGGLAPVGITFPAVAVIATATLIGVRPAVAVAAIGAAALTTTVLVAGTPKAIIAEGLLAVAAAILGGASRRQYQDRVEQAEQLLAERERADTEHARVPLHWPNATASDARYMTCSRTRWARCRCNSRPPTHCSRPMATRRRRAITSDRLAASPSMGSWRLAKRCMHCERMPVALHAQLDLTRCGGRCRADCDRCRTLLWMPTSSSRSIARRRKR